ASRSTARDAAVLTHVRAGTRNVAVGCRARHARPARRSDVARDSARLAARTLDAAVLAGVLALAVDVARVCGARDTRRARAARHAHRRALLPAARDGPVL